MDGRYFAANIADLTRGCKVRFSYLRGKQLNSVSGLVDKISRTAIVVGNEALSEIGKIKEIYNTKKYKVAKIENLEMKVYPSSESD